MNNLVHLTYRHMTYKISKVSADPRRGRSKGGTYLPRHRVLRPSLRRCDRTLLVYAEARHRTYVALDVSREKKRKWGGSWLGKRRTASSLARKELPSLPLAPGRSLMMQLNSNRRIDSAGIMILSWSETERGEARTIISPQTRSSRQNHRHSMAALPSERFVAAHRIATPCISCLDPRTIPSPSRASPGESREIVEARGKMTLPRTSLLYHSRRRKLRVRCSTNNQIQSSGWRIRVDIRFGRWRDPNDAGHATGRLVAVRIMSESGRPSCSTLAIRLI